MGHCALLFMLFFRQGAWLCCDSTVLQGGGWVRRVEGWDEEGGAGEGERRLEGKLNLLLSVNVYQAKRVNLL